MVIFDVCVVGGGPAGVRAAKILQQQGNKAILLEKSRGLGGRLSTRRIAVDSSLYQVELGLVLASPPFQSLCLQMWQEENKLIAWPELNDSAWVVAGKNTQALREMSRGYEVKTQCRAESIHFKTKQKHWEVASKIIVDEQPKSEIFYARNIILALPAPQVAQLLSESKGIALDTQEQEIINQQDYVMRWTFVLVAQGQAPDQQAWFPQRVFGDGLVESAFLVSKKPGVHSIEGANAWQVTASIDWSQKHCDFTKQHIQETFENEVVKAIQLAFGLNSVETLLSFQAHFWRYAQPVRSTQKNYLRNQRKDLYIIGDWLSGTGLDAAFLSAESMLNLKISIESSV